MKLLLADDHALFRDALVQYIERAEPLATVSLAKDLYEVIDLVEKDPEQDLILLDLRMPGMDGLKGLERIRNDYPNTPVALMSGVAEKEDVQTAMGLGAVGYFPKTLSGRALLSAIQLVLTGEKFIPIDQDTNTVMPSYYGNDGSQGPGQLSPYDGLAQNQNAGDIERYKLTPREKEVLSYLVQGASNKEIANALGLQLVTVKLHVRGVCQKLEAKNRTQAALRAKELGFGD